MPYIYKDAATSSSGGTGEYVLPTFSINTDTMEQIATQTDDDPVTFLTNDDSELLTEV